MIITNRNNLPAPLVNALSHDSYKRVGNISVTALLKAPRIRALEIRHDTEITEDISERIYRALGSSLHNLMESNASPNSLTEERLVVDVLGWKLSGKPDLLDNEGVLWDFKLTSVWAYILGGRTEWGQQLQIYGWLYYKHGFDVKMMKNLLVFRDYSQVEKSRMKDYPDAEAEVLEYDPMKALEVQGLVEERIRLHQAAEKLPDDKLPPCTAADKWEKPTTWAIMKPGRKSAVRVLESESLAQEYLKDAQGPFEIARRPGQCIRCLRYCKVAKWCDFGRSVLEAKQDD